MSHGRVYFVEAVGTDFIKIGFTKKLDDRIEALGEGVPYEIRLIHSIEGSYQTESILHRYFRPHRIRGEWFQSGPVRDWITSGCVVPTLEKVIREVEGTTLIRNRRSEKSAWVLAARESGKSLSRWIRGVLNQASSFNGNYDWGNPSVGGHRVGLRGDLTEVLHVRMSPGVLERMTQRALEKGVSVSALARDVLAREFPGEPEE